MIRMMPLTCPYDVAHSEDPLPHAWVAAVFHYPHIPNDSLEHIACKDLGMRGSRDVDHDVFSPQGRGDVPPHPIQTDVLLAHLSGDLDSARAQPVVRAQIGAEAAGYQAREVTEEEMERYWPRFVQLWPAYQAHFEKSGRRAVFVLEPIRDLAAHEPHDTQE